jgi:electron transfer flavoprotein beta subunit
MHIVVCMKQVPDSAQIRVHPVTNTIMRQGVPTIINPYDLFALEEAMRWRDRFGGEVTVLTMGPPMAEDSLRKALTFGADRAVLLTDRFFAGSDTLATSFALAGALAKIEQEFGKPLMIFTGKQTIDGDTAQVGPGIAKRLGLNQLTYVARIVDLAPEEGHITVERRAEGGVQVLSTRLPVLITMLEGVNEIRRGSYQMWPARLADHCEKSVRAHRTCRKGISGRDDRPIDGSTRRDGDGRDFQAPALSRR